MGPALLDTGCRDQQDASLSHKLAGGAGAGGDRHLNDDTVV